jgi:thiol:disulfide interchange protein DsbD
MMTFEALRSGLDLTRLRRHFGQIAMLLLLVVYTLSAPASAAPVKTGHLELELVAQGTAAPGKSLLVALRQTIAPGWHTYWRNPGDAGEATDIAWTLPKGWSAGPIIWPSPERVITGPLMNYVYSNAVILPSRLVVPADAAPGASVTLSAHVSLLVCKDVCVPEEANLTLNLPVEARATPDPVWGAKLVRLAAETPHPAGAKAVFALNGATLRLKVSGAAVTRALKAHGTDHVYFYPFTGTVIDHVKPQAARASGEDAVILALPAGYDFTHNKAPAHLGGVVSFADGKGFEIDAVPGLVPDAPAAEAKPAVEAAAPASDNAVAPSSSSAPIDSAPVVATAGATAATAAMPPVPQKDLGLPLAVLFALLGGLILNLMPCVFPVLSIKAAALARHTEHPAEARAEGLAYLAGVVASFLGLAIALIAARKAGEAVGWGFQLQSPGTVAALTLVMLASALNLSGVFEMGLSAQNAGSGLAAKGGLLGAFFTGVLAVVVAAPCTGPFMASTIGWAMAQSELTALVVFGALGVGLASPFVLLAFAPGLYRMMPRPGAWMETLRKVLAFPMYGAAAWLAWVYASEAGTLLVPWLYAAAIALSFGLWLWGVSQTAGTPRAQLTNRIGAVIAIASTVGILVAAPAPRPDQAGAAEAGQGVKIEVWSPQKVAELQAAGKPIFVDFTAAWCVTCKVNEGGALASSKVIAAFRNSGVAYLRADWTNRNAEIAKALQAHGRAGVPLYLVYGRKGGEATILPQLLTEDLLLKAIADASR